MWLSKKKAPVRLSMDGADKELERGEEGKTGAMLWKEGAAWKCINEVSMIVNSLFVLLMA
jgi:hypothetical protein